MSQPNVRNLPSLNKIPVYGHLLVQALKDLRTMVNNVGQQTNATPSAQDTPPPPPVNELRVSAGGGVVHLQAVHGNNFYRGITYHFHASPDAGFSNPVTLYSGPNRDVRIPVGTAPLHYAVTCDYPTSAGSPVTYHTAGGSSPVPVAAIGADQPAMPYGQGSGTGTPGQISGHGPIPFRGELPPRRI